MANMKTLTVNGVTYTVDDPDAVSYGATQALTEVEKQQARENIGAASPEQVAAAVAELADTDFPGDPGIKASYYAIKDKNQGFYILSGGRFQEEDGTKVDVAQLWPSKTSENSGIAAVVLRGIYPGLNDEDAVNKKQMEDAITALTEQDLDMNGHGIVNAEYYGVEKDNHGFFIESGGRVGVDGRNVDVALLTGLRNTAMPNVVIRGVQPGLEENDAVNKGQLDNAMDAAVRDVIDKTCPAFTESGAMVTCEPVEGYPLQVEWKPKNLAKLRTQVIYNTYGLTSTLDGDAIVINGTSTLAANNVYLLQDVTFTNGVMTISGTPTFQPGKYVIKTELVSGATSGCTIVLGVSPTGGTMQYSYVDIGEAKTLEFAQSTRLSVIAQFGNGGTAENARVRVQIEAGSAATAFEPYVEAPTAITRCGKNLLNTSKDNLKRISWNNAGVPNTSQYCGVELLLPPGSYVLKATPKVTSFEHYIYGQICDLNNDRIESWQAVVGSSVTAKAVSFDGWRRVYIYEATLSTVNSYPSPDTAYPIFSKFDIQIEVGSAATAFEPYAGEIFEVGDTIPALPGINTIYADAGLVTVTGRADPAAMIEKLTNAVISLGGNV